ncbi:Zinc knuckle CX2CX4HX4C [Kalmanozyma brasiliensis GHG001]|uniref:CCHC-type domain-containing protein n=1 Tax=Kalmanozyma brasiliensis (strain GHG001) TaxID=1365824 RepID=V5ES31_KALBG|nr:Zinc knuckle CX2CX4HX4C [Kalmanozyma brasiliensis GHG001]EST05748.1 Zinc knuckle CX2CX4HX4C [Kalmanozyma brasiliensis GHG001]
MTRYTKLDGRRSLAKKMVDSDSEPESTPVATPVKAAPPPTLEDPAAETPSKDKKKDKKDKKDKKEKKDKKNKDSGDDVNEVAVDEAQDEAQPTEPVASTSASAAETDQPAADAEPPTVEKLLKRAKLLKLKAKKAKNEESKKRFQKMTRDIERQVEQMFGSFEYGPKGQLIRLGAAQSDTMCQSRHKGEDWSGNQMGGDRGWGARGGAAQSYGNGGGYSNQGSNGNAGWGQTDEQRRMDRRDARREERADQRQSKLKCFACRGMGHSAKDCPNALDAQSISLKGDASTSDTPMIGRDAVGICFRCGSTEHTLSKCRKPALKNDELPYATCFICHSKGHLSSKCPNNAGRGVYPEGGSCKLCSSVEHLAKDCPLSLRNEGKSTKGDREAKALVNQVIVGSTKDQAAGGDEDDFHSFARKRAQVDSEAKVDKASPSKRQKSSAKVVSF